MKFTASSGEILKGLSKIVNVVPSKSTLPVLENVLLEIEGNKLVLSATDVELFISAEVRVEGTENGKITVPAKKMLDTIRALEDTSIVFHADTESSKVKMLTDTGEYNITGTPAEEFPVKPNFSADHKNQFSLNAELIKRAIQKTVFAVSKDELRPSLMGVFFRIAKGEITAVSTDGHRLVKFVKTMKNGESLKLENGVDIIVPAKALMALVRLYSGKEEETEIAVGESHIKFVSDSSTLISRIIDEAYPNYESVIPQANDKEMIVSRDQLVSSIRRVSLYANLSTHQIRFSIRKDKLSISAEDVDRGSQAKENIECKYNDESMEIGFNAIYINDVLSHIDNGSVKFRFSAPNRAGIVEPVEQKDDETLLMLTMPLRLST